MTQSGRVVGVQEVIAGSALSADATAGATTLYLDDVGDFDEAGGMLRVIAELGISVHSFTAPDDTALTVQIDPALAFNVATGEAVRVDPASVERYAFVGLEDADGDPILARIPHNLIRRIPPGTRQEDDREAVSVTEVSPGDFVVSDVLARGLARPGYGEMDWSNEFGVPLMAGNADSGVPFAILGTGTILPIFYAGGPAEASYSIDHTTVSRIGEGGGSTNAMVIRVEQPTILYADANAYCQNESDSTDFNVNFYIGTTIDGVRANGTAFKTIAGSGDATNNRARGLTCLRRIYVDPAGTPVNVHLWWGFRIGAASNHDMRIGGLKMRVIASYAPDANPDGSTVPAWTDDAATQGRYVNPEPDEA